MSLAGRPEDRAHEFVRGPERSLLWRVQDESGGQRSQRAGGTETLQAIPPHQGFPPRRHKVSQPAAAPRALHWARSHLGPPATISPTTLRGERRTVG